jgi:3',5'-cyclic AMP phosphodiesterase CpdA
MKQNNPFTNQGMVFPLPLRRAALSAIVVSIIVSLLFVCSGYGATSTADAIPSYAGWTSIDPAKTRFIVVSDTQRTSHFEFWRERNDTERKLIMDEMVRREPAFLVHLGDLTTRGSSKKEWAEFDDLAKGLRDKKIPVFPVLGNHEYYGNNQRALQLYFSRFSHLEQRHWYSFTWKNIGFLMFDANLPSLGKNRMEQESRWYLEELQRFEKAEDIQFVIVCCHKPPYTNSRTIGPSPGLVQGFVDPFVRLRKTRLFFSGHSHSYQRFEVGGKFFIVTGGGGGPRHTLDLDPAKEPRDLYPGPELRFFHFCEIENQGNTLAFKIVRLQDDGNFAVDDPLVIRSLP